MPFRTGTDGSTDGQNVPLLIDGNSEPTSMQQNNLGIRSAPKNSRLPYAPALGLAPGPVCATVRKARNTVVDPRLLAEHKTRCYFDLAAGDPFGWQHVPGRFISPA